jgi:hypothetical protein
LSRGASESAVADVHLINTFCYWFCAQFCSQDATAAEKHSNSDAQRNVVSGNDTLTEDDFAECATHGTTYASNSTSDDDRTAADSATLTTVTASATATAGVTEAGKLALCSTVPNRCLT